VSFIVANELHDVLLELLDYTLGLLGVARRLLLSHPQHWHTPRIM